VLGEAESDTMAVFRRSAELRARGVELCDLGAGEPSFPSPPQAVAAAIAALRAGHTRYTAVEGLVDLRRELALDYQEFGARWSGDDDVLVTVGAKSALLEAALSLVDPGSEVVIPTPCWQTLPAQVRLAGGRPVLVEMERANGFALEADRLIQALSSATRAVVINSPCNPTGAVMEGSHLRRLVAECARREIAVVSDETYGVFVYDDPDGEGRRATDRSGSRSSVASLAGEFPETVLLVAAFSKAFAMTGWRVGYALGPTTLIQAMRSVQSHMTTNATSFAMHGALAALRLEKVYQAEHVSWCAANREMVKEAFAGHPRLDYRPAPGSFYAFPRLELSGRGSGESTVEVARRLLDEQRVVVVPGEAFGAPGYLRISFAAARDQLAVGLQRIAEALA